MATHISSLRDEYVWEGMRFLPRDRPYGTLPNRYHRHQGIIASNHPPI
jgi:hypothetical protein